MSKLHEVELIKMHYSKKKKKRGRVKKREVSVQENYHYGPQLIYNFFMVEKHDLIILF